MLGTTIGRYRILGEIGCGGMATVYRGMDLTLGREVAVKVLHPHLSRNEEARARFNREAKAVAALKHTNIINIYDYSGPESEQLYIVTEFIKGENLEDFLQRTRAGFQAQGRPGEGRLVGLFPEVAAMIALHVCEALEHAHSHGVIHRDLKPENILIGKDGIIKVADFGIARVFSEDKMTQTGALIGSLAYMSPEQAEGKRVDHRSDIFSLGALFYRMVTGRGPFDAPTTSVTLRNLLDGSYPDPRAFAPSLSQELHGILQRCLMKGPGDRFQMMSLIKAELRKILAEAGIEDVEEEIKRYFCDPYGYEKSIKTTLVAQLISRAKTKLQTRRDAEALDDLNRVLALNGSNIYVLKILDGIRKKRRRREAARWVTRRGLPAAFLLSAGIFGAWEVWWEIIRPGTHHGQPGHPGEVSREGRVETQGMQIASEENMVQNRGEGIKGQMVNKGSKKVKSRMEITRRESAIVPKVAKITRANENLPTGTGSLDVFASPWARVFIDGQYMGNTPIQRKFSVASGEHTVSLQNPLCETYLEKVIVSPGETFTRVVTLKFLPGILSLRVDPEVRLTVDGKEFAVGQGLVRLRLPSGTHTIRAADPLAGPTDMDVELAPGETKDLDLRRR